MFFLWIFFILLLFLLLLSFSTIKVEIKNLKVNFPKINERSTNTDYDISLNLYLFNKIRILKSSITEKKIKKRGINQKFKELQSNLIKSRGNINIFDGIKILNVDIEKLNLKIKFGMEDAALTAMTVGTIAGVLGFLLREEMKDNDDVKFETYPIYKNQDFLLIYFNGIFRIKKIHIIHVIIYIFEQKRSVDKNGRTSNRRSYAYSNE